MGIVTMVSIIWTRGTVGMVRAVRGCARLEGCASKSRPTNQGRCCFRRRLRRMSRRSCRRTRRRRNRNRLNNVTYFNRRYIRSRKQAVICISTQINRFQFVEVYIFPLIDIISS